MLFYSLPRRVNRGKFGLPAMRLRTGMSEEQERLDHQGGVLHGASVMEVLNAALQAADPYRSVSEALRFFGRPGLEPAALV